MNYGLSFVFLSLPTIQSEGRCFCIQLKDSSVYITKYGIPPLPGSNLTNFQSLLIKGIKNNSLNNFFLLRHSWDIEIIYYRWTLIAFNSLWLDFKIITTNDLVYKKIITHILTFNILVHLLAWILHYFHDKWTSESFNHDLYNIYF